MIEPTVQDYLRAAAHLDRDAFCRQFRWPILVAAAGSTGLVYQTDPTLVSTASPRPAEDLGAGFTKEAPVFEVTSQRAASGGKVTIGRSEENDLVLHDKSVSGRHAVFSRVKADRYTIEDLDSTNGTRLNQAALNPGEPVQLEDGDVLHLGDSKFKFFYPSGLYELLARARA